MIMHFKHEYIGATKYLPGHLNSKTFIRKLKELKYLIYISIYLLC